MKKALILVLMAFAVLVSGCSNAPNTASGSTESYQTSGDWALEKNYMFAVEVDGFDGDTYAAGTYLFEPQNTNSTGNVPIVWDIYVSDVEYSNASDLNDDELIGSVGGLQNQTCTETLLPGQFVYVIYNETAGEPAGSIHIEKQS